MRINTVLKIFIWSKTCGNEPVDCIMKTRDYCNMQYESGKQILLALYVMNIYVSHMGIVWLNEVGDTCDG